MVLGLPFRAVTSPAELDFEILPRLLDHPDVRPLLDRLDAELTSTEPDGGICFIHIDPSDVAPGNGGTART